MERLQKLKVLRYLLGFATVIVLSIGTFAENLNKTVFTSAFILLGAALLLLIIERQMTVDQKDFQLFGILIPAKTQRLFVLLSNILGIIAIVWIGAVLVPKLLARL
jgi:hypothetical protein